MMVSASGSGRKDFDGDGDFFGEDFHSLMGLLAVYDCYVMFCYVLSKSWLCV